MAKKILLFTVFVGLALGFEPGGHGITRSFAFSSLLKGGDIYGHDILKDRQVANATRRLLGRDYQRFNEILNVSPPVKVIGGRYVFGQGCEPHNCVDSGALIVVDTRERKVWAAMTDGETKKSWPGSIARWPAPIRQIVQSSYE